MRSKHIYLKGTILQIFTQEMSFALLKTAINTIRNSVIGQNNASNTFYPIDMAPSGNSSLHKMHIAHGHNETES